MKYMYFILSLTKYRNYLLCYYVVLKHCNMIHLTLYPLHDISLCNVLVQINFFHCENVFVSIMFGTYALYLTLVLFFYLHLFVFVCFGIYINYVHLDNSTMYLFSHLAVYQWLLVSVYSMHSEHFLLISCQRLIALGRKHQSYSQ